MIDADKWADYLIAAVADRNAVAPIVPVVGELPLDDAYAIQAAVLDRRLTAGDALAGAKLGLTSVAKQQQMGVDEPCYGWVYASSVLSAGDDGVAEVKVSDLIHPRCEPEFVFVMAQDCGGSDVTGDDVLDASASVVGGIEVIDSRFEKFSFTLADVVADNTSAARVVIGSDGVAPRSTDLQAITCEFEVDGVITGSATGAALLGDPAACVAMLARHLAKYDRKLEAGWTVMAGAPTDAQPLTVGTQATARYGGLGAVSIRGV